MLYFAIFFILFIVYIALFRIKIKAAFEYTRNDRGEWVVISFYTGNGLVRYEYEIPLIKKNGEKVRFKLVKGQNREMREDTKKEEKLFPFGMFEKYNSVKIYLKDHSSLFEDVRRYLNKKDIHVELNIKLRQGTGDAAQTGVLCGLIWAAAGILASHITRYLKCIKRNIHITPCFDKRIFEVKANCIFHVKLVHIIVVLIKIYHTKYLIAQKSKRRIGGELSG